VHYRLLVLDDSDKRHSAKAHCSALMRRVINATNKDGGVNAGQLLDVVVEESAVFIDRSMR
jgi:hypothetical protein